MAICWTRGAEIYRVLALAVRRHVDVASDALIRRAGVKIWMLRFCVVIGSLVILERGDVVARVRITQGMADAASQVAASRTRSWSIIAS